MKRELHPHFPWKNLWMKLWHRNFWNQELHAIDKYHRSPPFYLTKEVLCNYNIIMDEIIFEWDPVKAELNYTKHKVTFEEAKSIFYDENAILIADPDHSSMDEDRFVMLGLSSELHMLVVCHCYRENDRIRIISARRANTLEAAQYGGK